MYACNICEFFYMMCAECMNCSEPDTVLRKLWKCIILCHICVDYVLISILF